MGDTEKEFSYVEEFQVCYGPERVNGLQLTLRMHRFDYDREDRLIKQHQLDNYYAAIDKRIAESVSRRMTLIGTASG